MELTVAKSGTTQLSTSLMRSKLGLTVRIKVSPQVEEFIRNLGTGDVLDVQQIGRFWVSDTPDVPLKVYDLRVSDALMGPLSTGRERFYRIDRPGSRLIEQDPDSGKFNLINLSFIRLAGASDGNGVTFNIRGVHTTEAIQELRDAISESFVAFYKNYMKPINLSVMVSTQEI